VPRSLQRCAEFRCLQNPARKQGATFGPAFHIYVAHVRLYGADYQWVRVPHQEESICLGS